MAGVKRFGVLEGERLRLRPLTETDFELYAALYGDDNILRYISPALDKQTLESSFAIAIRLNQKEQCKRTFLVTELLDSTVVGILGLTVSEQAKKIEIGVIFKPEFQKNNLAFEALQTLIRFIQAQYSSYLIVAHVDPNNRAAVWLSRKLGFTLNNETGYFELHESFGSLNRILRL